MVRASELHAHDVLRGVHPHREVGEHPLAESRVEELARGHHHAGREVLHDLDAEGGTREKGQRLLPLRPERVRHRVADELLRRQVQALRRGADQHVGRDGVAVGGEPLRRLLARQAVDDQLHPGHRRRQVRRRADVGGQREVGEVARVAARLVEGARLLRVAHPDRDGVAVARGGVGHGRTEVAAAEHADP